MQWSPDEILAGIDAGRVLPGHGAPWSGGVAEASRLVRDATAAH